ncbi:MAG: hypothetical protein RRZ73_00195 [Oscillospiraceae bacterium]
MIIIGIALSYYALTVQRCQVVCTVTKEPCCKSLPDVFPIRALSSILILAGLIFFFNTASVNRCSETTDCVVKKSNDSNYLAALLVLLAGIVRFEDLFFVQSNKKSC